MTDPLTTVLGGLLIAIASGIAGKSIGSGNKISEDHCSEKQKSCQKLIIEKIDHLDKKFDDLVKVVNNKLFGI